MKLQVDLAKTRVLVSSIDAATYKFLRTRIGSQAEVAEMMGVSRPLIQKRETGSRPITTEGKIAILTLALPLLTDGLAPLIPLAATAPVAALPPTGKAGGEATAHTAEPPATPAAPAGEFNPIAVLGLKNLPDSWSVVHKAAKKLLVEHPVGSLEHDRIVKAQQEIWDTHFGTKNTDDN